MNTKPIPAIIMLISGALTCIVTFIYRYPLKDTLLILLGTLITFLFIGYIVKKILDSFQFPRKEEQIDGEMIEKQLKEKDEGKQEEKGNEPVPETKTVEGE
ncbi:hypothetical protein D7X25_22380 [bacterium 1XD42-8]|jgi:hypothetical protein|nr:hypothetical protein [Lachnospiraceae bacterium]RKJ47418.1 hypothetical protein D7X25_22380 [bacterium 1XD42-8]